MELDKWELYFNPCWRVESVAGGQPGREATGGDNY